MVSEVLGALTPNQVLDTKFLTRSHGSTTTCAFVILQCAHGSVQCGIRMVLYYENMYRREQQNLPEANFLFAAIGYVEFRLAHVRFRFCIESMNKMLLVEARDDVHSASVRLSTKD